MGVDNSRSHVAGDESFGLIVRFTLRAGHEREFDELVAATVAQIDRLEPGTLLYVTHAVEDSPRTRVFYELYRDRDAFAEHEQQLYVRRFLAERERLVEAVDVDRVAPLVHAGLRWAQR